MGGVFTVDSWIVGWFAVEINEYEVKPVLERVTKTVAAAAAVLVITLVSLNVSTNFSNPYEQYSPEYLSRLQSDEKLAQREQRRALERGVRPAYCDDRYYRARSGGALCN